MRSRDSIKKYLINHLKSLGIYKVEYTTTINILADMLHQYEQLTKEFRDNGYKVEEEYTNKAGAKNMRKTPVYGALEKLRMDISTYSNLLCLNPKSFENVTAEIAEKSKLDKILDGF